MNQQVITVLGGGSFGTVLANIAAENGNKVYQWMRSSDQAERMAVNRENERYLPGCKLHPGLIPVTDFADALAESSLVLVAIPSSHFRQVVSQIKPYLTAQHALVSTTKGVEAGTFKLMSEVIGDEAPQCRVGVISGPNLAKEVATRQLTATVIASESEELCAKVQSAFHCDYFRVYAGSDVYGVELGGALKNIYAIAAGMCAAMGMGENTRSMLMTRSLAEMSRFAVRMGADPMTFLGLAGVGDLIVTCMSPLSRNYRVGFALGQGRDLEGAVSELGEVAEGVNTIKYVKAKADELGVYMPLVGGLFEVVFNKLPVQDVVRKLMLSQQGEDVEFEVLDKSIPR
ncbi:NAD(P)H-dependent glycerol-3-phosphate dehydrogenase [Motiliproteus sp. MSK22-1]|uniref:NAD(P)H-dependent glycerol-3-phosphate dehydrogenase n=1 Tax=Motiliproteus sp. MSK22-1 TaxID=1897630 RepID=UPI000975D60C|nr:NAD(P)H-dependent glycerol-3-phosphate dehydrogenase [Motiliproteus sp. MSK22-1]OMH38722.1 glycerol-3-phosphate dehydrogenase [Motiliproteus sp. MSK22-1]